MTSTCEAYQHSEQKRCQKFCRSKEDKNGETHPEKPEKGETGCVLGAGEDRNGWGRVQPDEKTQCPNQSEHHSRATQAKRKPAKTQCFRRFCGRGRRTCLGCRLGRFAAERHWRSLTPRHALRRAQPCLVAKSYRTLTKKSGTAEAIPDFFGRGRRTWSRLPPRSGLDAAHRAAGPHDTHCAGRSRALLPNPTAH